MQTSRKVMIVAAASLVSAFVALMAAGEQRKSSSETLWMVVQGLLGGAFLGGLGMTWYLKKNDRVPPRFGLDAQGLPIAEWQDVLRSGGRMDHEIKVSRHCRIEIDTEGTARFVHEFVEDASAKHVPVAAVLGGQIGVAMAKSFMKSRGVGVTASGGSAPWSALQAFVLTDDFEYFGQRTMSGDRPQRPDAVIVADCGSEWGQIVVSRAAVTPDEAASLHRLLTLSFIERRSGHLSRIAADSRQKRNESAGPRQKRI